MKQTALVALWFAATLMPLPGLSANVTTTADSGPGSLRAAIASAAPGDTISFSVTGTISLTSGELSITTPLTIAGPGPDQLTVQRSSDAGTPAFRLFAVESAAASLSGLTLGNGRLDGVFENGGAIYVFGRATIDASSFIDNSVPDRGGGIHVDYFGEATINQCAFSDNQAS